MRILILLHDNSHNGGSERLLNLVAKFYKDEELTIYCLQKTTDQPWFNDKNLEVTTLSKTSYFLGILRLFWILLFSRKKFDRSFSSSVITNGIIGILRRFRIVSIDKVVARESTSIFLRFKGLKLQVYKLFYKVGYKGVDLIICQTQLMNNQFLTNLSFLKNKKIVVIPNPINLQQIRESEKEVIDLNLSDDYIVAAGRLIEVKRFDLLIESFKKLKKDHNSLKLLILGRGPLEQSLKALVSKLDLNDDVLFPGNVKNVYPYFKQAKLCVISSEIEGFPNVLLEMMSQNTTIVSTRCAGGIEDISGIFTCEPNSIDDLENVMLKSLSQNNEKNRQLFDTFLEKRDIKNFIEILDDALN
ncbi:glycosyltransferase [Flavobacteriaceae sp. LMIT009]